MFYDSDIYLVEWRESRWLVLSSIMSLIPTAYSLFHSLFFLSSVSLISTAVSANYWRKATISSRRDLDLVLQKLIFIIYLSNGLYYIRGYRNIIFVPCSIYLIYNYYYSNLLYNEKKNEWLIYHLRFHMMVLIGQMIVLESIQNESKSKYH